MIKNKAFKFRIYPNDDQIILINKTFGCTRLIYNTFLSLCKDSYDKDKTTISYNAQASMLVGLKNQKDFLKEVDSIALQQSLKHLQTAFKNFFRDPSVGFPQFKKKYICKFSYTTMMVNNNIKVGDNYVILPKLKKIKMKKHREIPDGYRITSVTVSKTPTEKYYVSFTCEYEAEEQEKKYNANNAVGLDFAMQGLFVASDGSDGNYPNYYRKMEKKLAREQRKLSKCVKFSNNYKKQRRKVARIHEKIANQRRDFLHKLSNSKANEFDIVCIEDLNMKAMSQYLNFGKSVHDDGWGMFITFLAYKLEDRNKMLIKIDKWCPSSKTCHVCGNVIPKLELSQRSWGCPECGTVHHRDLNASKNILREGLRILKESTALN